MAKHLPGESPFNPDDSSDKPMSYQQVIMNYYTLTPPSYDQA